MFKQVVLPRSREYEVRMLLCSGSSRFLRYGPHPFGAAKTTGST